MRIGMGCKAQTAGGPCGPARICNAAARPSSRFHAHGQTLNRFSGRRAGLPHHRGSAPAVHHRLRPPRKPQARHAAGRRHHGRKAPPHRMAGGAALFSGGEGGECGMTNALVHKTGAAIQWARDYGQAHPKMQGIFWIISTAILTIVPNELVEFIWKFTGKYCRIRGNGNHHPHPIHAAKRAMQEIHGPQNTHAGVGRYFACCAVALLQ